MNPAQYMAQKQAEIRKVKGKDTAIYTTTVIDEDGYLVEQIKAPTPTFLRYNHITHSHSTISALRVHGQEYKPMNDDIITKQVVKLPTEASAYQTTESLKQEIKQFIHTYLDISAFDEEVATHYILLTWLYDKLDTITYLGIYGDFGSGKTRAAKTIGSLCYKSAMVSGSITTAPIYRILEQSRGTLVLNEFDFENSNFDNELIKILNNGYERGMFVMRTNKDSGKTECFDAFSPKIFTYRRKKKDLAFESRLITINVVETKREDIPTILPPCFEEEAEILRNKLLQFRFDNFKKKPVVDSSIFKGIDRRVRQTLYPLFSVIDDQFFQQQLLAHAKEMQAQLIQDRGATWEAEAFQVLLGLIEGEHQVTMRDYATAINTKEVLDKPIAARKAGSIIRNNFMLATDRATQGEAKGQFVLVVDWERITSLCKKYGLEPPQQHSLHSQPSLPDSGVSEHSEGGEHCSGTEFEQSIKDSLF